LPAHFESWKVEIAEEIHRRAESAGLTGSLAVAVAIAESGLDFHASGDAGCSKSLFQWNECVRGKMPDDIIGAWIGEVSENAKRSGWSEDRGLTRWNAPQLAEHGSWWQSAYLKKVRKIHEEIKNI